MVSSSRSQGATSRACLTPPPPGRVRFVPLGGVGEIGKNLALVEVGDDVVAVDLGLAFPDQESNGADVVLPDIGFLRSRLPRLRAILLTHGHEDHIGGLPFYLSELDVPVYGTDMTIGLLRNKLERRGFSGRARLHPVGVGERLSMGSMWGELVHMTHSVPGSCGLALHTAAGTVVHSGDFKLDHAPVGSPGPDLQRLAELGREGVELLLSDSTNAVHGGLTPSESTVRPALRRALEEAPGRVIVVSFASNLARIRQALELSQEVGRRCCLVGRSLLRNADTATRLGYFRPSPGLLAGPRELGGIPPAQLCLIATGSQGEPLAALSRIAAGTHPFIRIRGDDTVVLAANPIPGNEATVGRIVNRLVERGVRVLAGSEDGVHASGHASAEELSFLLRLVRPRSFVPVHGQPRHLDAHARLAVAAGVAAERVPVLENGSMVELGEGSCRLVGRVSAGSVEIDAEGRSLGLPGGPEEDLVVLSLTLDRGLRQLVAPPEAVVSGATTAERERALRLGRSRVRRALEGRRRSFEDPAEVREVAGRALSGHLARSGSWRPRVLTVVNLV